MFYIIDTVKFNRLLNENNLHQYQCLDSYINSGFDISRYIIVDTGSTSFLNMILSTYGSDNNGCVIFDNYKNILGITYTDSLNIKHFNNVYVIKFYDITIDDETCVELYDLVMKLLKESIVKEMITSSEVKQWISDKFLNELIPECL